ncbi:hypothetical protein CP533_3930 [Ophiocordyceps camponoti-saundersi (nom. inval.)]|nr:hypothetical protein CP533_3930 [Ophiocordyceps camponoti-saundersi (nom. inval.)]
MTAMEEATRRHFFFHDEIEYADEQDDCHWCQLLSFPLQNVAPITVVNSVDSEVLPPGFRFIDENVLGDGVEPAELSFRSGCTCDNDDDCQYGGCMCLAELEDDDGGKIYAYHTHGIKKGLLRSKLHDSKLPLYECHKGCSCTLDCPNRVVERGRTVPLQIFRTDDRGWGVRTQEFIKRGQFVDRYVGEVITSAEADRRRAAAAISQCKDVYLFALDKFTDPTSLDARLQGPSLEVDGEFMSGPTRFINHSCDPNLRIFARVGDHADKHLHGLAFFAIKDISKGEELTFDYVDGGSLEAEERDGTVDEMTHCLCGSAKCRGFLW